MVEANRYAHIELSMSLLRLRTTPRTQCVNTTNKNASRRLSAQQTKHDFHNLMPSFCNVFWCPIPARLDTFTTTNVPAVYLWREVVGVPD